MTAPTGPGRHEARERALELLYQADTRGLRADELLDALPLDPDPYAVSALKGVEANAAEVDRTINEYSDGWTVNRMPLVDRAILRLATWELLHRAEVPVAVIIDEAVELAKDYSTERAPSFINGVLDSTAKAARV